MRQNLLQRQRWAPLSRHPRFRPVVELLEARVVPSIVDHSGGFASHSDLTFNGSAGVSGSVAQLTTGENQAGSFFTNSQVEVSPFTIDFTFQAQGATTAAGGLTLTFNNDAAGPAALGAGGAGLGFSGLKNSLAFFFEPSTNTTGLMISGQPDTSVSVGNGVNLQNQDVFDVTLTSNGSAVTETITDTNTKATFSTSFDVNIQQQIGSSTAFVGFTGSTGPHGAVQGILTWLGTFGSQANAPTISSLRPGSIQEGNTSFILVVNGSNFASNATVQWTQNGMTTPLTPFFFSTGQLQVLVPSTLIAIGQAGTVSVTVVQVVNGSTLTSNAAPFTITPNSAVNPVITSLNPSSVQEGSGSFILTVNGSGFVPSATVQWTENGMTTPLTPFAFGSTQLPVAVPSNLVAVGQAGTVSITVVQAIGGSTLTSNTATFTITPGSTVLISSLNPNSVQEGSGSFVMTVNGSGFAPAASVQWTENGMTTPLTPFSNSSNQLLVVVPSTLVAVGQAGTVSVTVVQIVNGGTQMSNAATFTVTPSSAVLPVISSLNPSSVQEGSSSFVMTVNGSGFVLGATVQWTENGTTTTPLIPFSNSNNQLLVVVPPSLVAIGQAGTVSVTVVQVVNGNTLTSNTAIFNITPSLVISPVITSLNPSSVQEGSGSFVMTVNGSGFVPGATVQWTQNNAPTTLTVFSNSGSQLQVVVPSTLVAVGQAGTVSVTVVQVVNGSTLTSNTAIFNITPSSTVFPVISSLSPSSIQEGSSSFTLTVFGSGFVLGAAVQWTENGMPTTLTPFSNSSSQLQVVVPSSLVAIGQAGTVSITVVQVVNGSTLTSNAAIFTITPVSTLTAIGLDITATVNVAQDFTVVQFTDLSPNAQTGAYAVPIDFGDGTPLQPGRVTQPGGSGTPFFVDATHTYTQIGTFTVHVRIFKEIEGFAQTFSTATVSAAGAPNGPGGGRASLPGQGLVAVNELQASPVQQATSVPVMVGQSANSSRSSAAGDDLYWIRYSARGGRLGDLAAWAADDLTLALQGTPG